MYLESDSPNTQFEPILKHILGYQTLKWMANQKPI